MKIAINNDVLKEARSHNIFTFSMIDYRAGYVIAAGIYFYVMYAFIWKLVWLEGLYVLTKDVMATPEDPNWLAYFLGAVLWIPILWMAVNSIRDIKNKPYDHFHKELEKFIKNASFKDLYYTYAKALADEEIHKCTSVSPTPYTVRKIIERINYELEDYDYEEICDVGFVADEFVKEAGCYDHKADDDI